MARMEAPANDKLDTDPFQIRVARHEVSTGRRGHGERRLCSVQRATLSPRPRQLIRRARRCDRAVRTVGRRGRRRPPTKQTRSPAARASSAPESRGCDPKGHDNVLQQKQRGVA
jgi:hypothetical protein